MRFNLRQNLYLKLFSVFLAAVCWFVVSSEEERVRDFAVPLDYVDLPRGLEMAGRVVDTISVRLRASEPILRTITEDRLSARIDLSRAVLGEQHIPLVPELIRIPGGADVVSIAPDRIEVKIEKRVRREVPVVAEFAGQAPRGYEKGRHSIDPPLVTIEGPASEVAKVSQATTGTIVLNGETSDYEVEVKPIPDAPPGSRVRVVAPSGPVRVRVTIRPAGTGQAPAPARERRSAVRMEQESAPGRPA
ncbi:MAG TPA: CdaR family protein [Candidatus Polarisedimenticolia bacterium]|nr:CdaR family protein [Candidatus Polarisedimenticolia bacterium]